jgi:hypothetical protein
MIAEPEVVAKTGSYPESDAKYRSTKAIDFWEVVETPHFASGAMQLRVRVMYPNGTVHMLGAAFADRSALNNYIDRWLPTFVGKEKTSSLR